MARLIVIIVLFLMAGLPFSQAAENESLKLSLSRAIEMALNNNSLIKEALENEQGSFETKKGALAEFLPKVSLNYSFTGLSETPFMYVEQPTATGSKTIKKDIGSDSSYHWDLTLVQPLFTGFALSTGYKMAELGIENQKLAKEIILLEVAKRVKQAYFNVLLSQKVALVTEDSVKNLKSHEKDAANFYNQGMIPYNDLLRSKVALADVIQKMEKAKANVKIAHAILNTLLELDLNKNLEVEDLVNIPPVPGNLDKIVEGALANRPELFMLKLALKNLEFRIKLAKSSDYPTVAMIGRYEQNGDDLMATNNDFRNQYNSSLTLQASWTFFSGGKTRASTAKFRSDQRALKEKLKGLENGIKLETQNAFINLKVAKKNIQTAKESLTQAGENWRITNLQYQQQIVSSTEVLDARTFLSQAKTNYYSARYGYMISMAKLRRAMGER